MRKPLVIAAVLLVAGVFAAPYLIDANRFRGVVQSQLEKSLARPVQLGSFHLRVVPLSLRITDVTIGQPAGFVSKSPFLTVKDVSAGLALWPLLRGDIEVQSVSLDTPSVTLLKNAAGVWNYETPGASSESSKLPDLTVTDGRLALNGTLYEHINAKLENNRTLTLQTAGAKLPLILDYDVKQSGETYQINSLTAKLGALALNITGSASASRLQLQAKSAQAPVGDLLQLAALLGGELPADLKVQGLLTTDVAITGTPQNPQFNGKIEATQAEFSSKDLAAPVRASALRIALTPRTLTTEPFTLETGGTKLQAQATIEGYSDSKPRYTAALKTNGASVEELLRMASAYGLRPAGLSGKGTVTLDLRVTNDTYSGSGTLRGVTVITPSLPKPLEISTADLKFAEDRIALDDAQLALGQLHAKGNLALRGNALTFNAAIDELNVDEIRSWKAASGSGGSSKLTANGTLSIGKVLYDKLPLEDVKATVAFAGGLLRVEPFTARLFGGTQAGAITADLRPTPSQLSLKSTITNVESGQLLAATSSVKNILAGPVSGTLDLGFAPKGDEELARSLNGNMQLQMSEGKLRGSQFINGLATFLNNGTRLSDNIKLGGTFRVANGVATTDNLVLDLGAGAVAVEGTLGLVDQAIKLRLQTKMANGFTAPAIITGTFANPRFAPDLERIGPKNITDAVGGILDRFRKKK